MYGKGLVYEHERRFHIVNRQHAILLSVHGLGEEAPAFFDLALFLGGYVVFLGEF